MIIDIDCGNSLLKWRIDGSQQAPQLNYDNAQYSSAWDAYTRQVKRVRVSSVAGPEVNKQLSRYWFKTANIDIEFATAEKNCAGLSNGYDQYQQLGTDRWLAMLAAWSKTQSACIIVDAGTTTTVDVINGDGQHLGGYIVPGLHLLRQSLDSTAMDLASVQRAGSSPTTFGSNTNAAINSGIIQMSVGLIIGTIDQCFVDHHFAEDGAIQLYLCGGNADSLLEPLQNHSLYRMSQSNLLANSFSVSSYREAVLDGLALALP